MELLTGLTFVFNLTVFYSWGRFKNHEDSDGNIQYQQVPTRRDRRTSSIPLNKYRASTGSKAMLDDNNSPKPNINVGCAGCFFYTLVIIGLWGLMVFGSVIVLFTLSDTESVSRF